MIGMIITGHGTFASGMRDMLMLIAGKQQALEVVEFYPGDSIEDLTDKLSAAWERLETYCDDIVIVTDISGGSPFNVAIRQKMQRGNGEVIGSANAPLLLEAAMNQKTAVSAQQLAADALKAGREYLLLFTPCVLEEDGDEVDEE